MPLHYVRFNAMHRNHRFGFARRAIKAQYIVCLGLALFLASAFARRVWIFPLRGNKHFARRCDCRKGCPASSVVTNPRKPRATHIFVERALHVRASPCRRCVKDLTTPRHVAANQHILWAMTSKANQSCTETKKWSHAGLNRGPYGY